MIEVTVMSPSVTALVLLMVIVILLMSYSDCQDGGWNSRGQARLGGDLTKPG